MASDVSERRARRRTAQQLFDELAVDCLHLPRVSRAAMFGSDGLRVGVKFFAFVGRDGQLIVKLPVAQADPKFRSGHETPAELVAAAAIVTCDSPQQAAAYPEPFFTGSAPLVSLPDVLLGAIPGRQHRCDTTVHCSVGLAGSEVLLAHSFLRSGKKDPAAKVP